MDMFKKCLISKCLGNELGIEAKGEGFRFMSLDEKYLCLICWSQ